MTTTEPVMPYSSEDMPGVNAYQNGFNECLRRMQPLIEECRKALAEELAAYDIDPPIHHIKQAHDSCTSQLAAIAPENFP